MARLLWEPLWPQLADVLHAAPNNPLHATFAALVLAPFALPLVFLLPPVLIGDAFLQFLYRRFGGPVEVLWEDGWAMLRIALDNAALGGKEATRVLNQIRLKLQEDPAGVLSDAVSEALYAAGHPIKTARTLHAYAMPALYAFWKSLRLSWWIKDPAGGTPAKKEGATGN